ncbi:MAG: ribosome silencing factor [Bacteroidota bacterium]
MNSIKIETQKSALPTAALNDLIIDSIQDIKGKNILRLDLAALDEAPTDHFIICEGESTVQVRSIAENIQKRLKLEQGILPSNVEGMQGSRWICLDYFYTVVHVFHYEAREFYELEDLWSDARTVEYENL